MDADVRGARKEPCARQVNAARRARVWLLSRPRPGVGAGIGGGVQGGKDECGRGLVAHGRRCLPHPLPR